MNDSIWPVIAAAISSALIGIVWYHPRVFGTLWMREANISPEMAEHGARYRHMHFLLGLLASLITAYVARELMVHIGITDIGEAYGFGILIWIGFVVPVSASAFLWEHRSLTFYLLNISYWFVVCSVMSIILVLS